MRWRARSLNFECRCSLPKGNESVLLLVHGSLRRQGVQQGLFLLLGAGGRYRRQFAEASGGCGANAAMGLLVLPGVASPDFAIRARHAGEPAMRQLLLGVGGLPRQEVMERRTKSLHGVYLVRLWVAFGVPTVAGLVRQVWVEGLTG